MPLFVSYYAVWKGEHRGWLVFDADPIKTSVDVKRLAERVEAVRGWPHGTVIIVSFQRLETA